MQLVRLVLNGFKSFASKTEFRFHPSISSIVGPNGSGKSNILDAIRWALGEQSPRALRGSRMTDVIFSGTEEVKPREEAEVILELEGEEFSGKKRIKRRVDSEGKGSYYIDNQTCRLKDIKDLFLDSGVGSHGYALVGQGEVEGIILSSPHERRKLFDEVAGILKIRIHKEEAAEGLEETERDLQRIRDIIQELKMREGPLQQEAERAKKHAELREALKKKEVNLLLHQYLKERETLREIEAELHALEEGQKEKKKSQDQLEDGVQKLREALEEKGDGLIKKKEDLIVLHTRLQETRNIFRLNQEKESHFLGEEKRIEGQEKRIGERLEDLERREEALKREEFQIQLHIEKHAFALKEREGLLESMKDKEKDLQKEAERLENLHFQDREDLLLREKNREHLQRDIAESQEKMQLLLSRLMEEEEELQKRRREIQEQREEISHLEEVFYGVGEELVALEKKRGKTAKEREAIVAKALQAQKEVESLCTRLQLLQEMEEDYRGFFPGVRSLLKERENHPQWGPGILGVVAHLIFFESRLKEAITAALGTRGQNVVVRKERDARFAVSFLHERSLGRVTFLPLDTIQDYNFHEKEREQLQGSGILGPLVTHITYDDEVAPAILHLLGRVVLTEDLEPASNLARRFKYRLKIVTLKGDLLLPGGAITGGSQKEKKGIIQRKGEMGELREKLKALEPEKKRMDDEIEKVEAYLQSLERAKEEKRGEVHSKDLKLTSLKEELLYRKREEAQLKKKKEELLEERDRAEEKILHLTERFQALQEEEGSSQETRDTLLQLQKNKEEQNHLEEKKEELTALVTSLQVKLATANQEREQLKDRLLDLDLERETLKKQRDQAKKEREGIEVNRKKLKEKQAILKEDELEYEERSQEMEGKISFLKLEREKIQSQLKKEEESYLHIRRELEEIINGERSLNLKFSRSKVQLESYKERLEEHRVTIKEEMSPLYKITSMRREQLEVKKWKEDLEDLGSVNPGAIEEYREVKERLTFLTEQSQDLIEAREAMKKVIKEIESGMKERFLETFQSINEAFQEVFSQLFQGGYARLHLSDEKDPLESGVEMMAQPPGKKLQNLSLMSGGEKALTAIALIFALLKVQPSPFYILDEIDASLDETNLERFVYYMGTCATTQFIIITHRRQTMAMADILFGLTMRDGAISQLLSVNLKEREEKAV